MEFSCQPRAWLSWRQFLSKSEPLSSAMPTNAWNAPSMGLEMFLRSTAVSLALACASLLGTDANVLDHAAVQWSLSVSAAHSLCLFPLVWVLLLARHLP